MLVLSRRHDESVIVGRSDGLGPAVKITVLQINYGSVRLGFETNRDVPVYREEIWKRIRDDGSRDSSSGDVDPAGSQDGNGKSNVLSEGGEGIDPDSAREPVVPMRGCNR